jgi:hypothetical protein
MNDCLILDAYDGHCLVMPHGEIRIAIVCHGCGQAGTATWCEHQNDSPRITCDIVRLSGGFRANGRDGVSGDTQIVCTACDAVVPG